MPEGGGGGFDDGSQSEVNPALPVPCTLLPERKGIVLGGGGGHSGQGGHIMKNTKLRNKP